LVGQNHCSQHQWLCGQPETNCNNQGIGMAGKCSDRKNCLYLGLQIAPGKKRGPEQLPGVWQGAIAALVPHPISRSMGQGKGAGYEFKRKLEDAHATGIPSVFEQKGL
jgi:hypothetical protein